MVQLFLMAYRNLLQHTRRTLLLGGAICGVTALLVFLLCLAEGIHRTMLTSATTLSTGHINVAGFYKVTAGQSAPVITGYQKLAEIVRKTLPDLDFVVARGRGWAKLVSDTGAVQAAIGGINITSEARFREVIKVVHGKIDDLAQPGTILIFEEQAKKLDVDVGDTVVISSETSRGINNTIDVRVVAIAEDMGIMTSWNVFIPDDSVRELEQLNTDTTGALHVHLKDVRKIPEAMDILRKTFEGQGYILMDREAAPFWQKFDSVNREDWKGQKLDLTTWEEEVSFFKWILAAIDGLTFVLIAILIVIISIGIMNSVWIAIRERTREIGTLRAIGMRRWRVLIMFLVETFTLALVATTCGALLGIAFSAMINAAHLPIPEGAQWFLMSNTLTLSLAWDRILIGVGLITLSTTLIATLPSLHAARLKPITAMQHHG
jgi:ABC-type lipoprotein release transport system permease subunit